MYLEIFLADFAVFRVFLGISWDFAEIPEFRGSATVRIIRSPDVECLKFTTCRCYYKGSTLSSVILRTWGLVQPVFEPATPCLANQC